MTYSYDVCIHNENQFDETHIYFAWNVFTIAFLISWFSNCRFMYPARCSLQCCFLSPDHTYKQPGYLYVHMGSKRIVHGSMAHHSSLDPGMLDLTPDIRQELQRLSEQRDLMMQKAQGYESSLEAERQAGGCWKSQTVKRTVSGPWFQKEGTNDSRQVFEKRVMIVLTWQLARRKLRHHCFLQACISFWATEPMDEGLCWTPGWTVNILKLSKGLQNQSS